jgi:histone acetyltransferase (RNA polymerase elongator complex component)
VSRRDPIAPVLLPHDACPTACPYCPEEVSADTADLLPDPIDVTAAIDRVFDRRSAQGRQHRPVEIAFFGGDLWVLPRALRTALLDVAEWEVRRGRARGIRLTLSPSSVLRAPLLEFQARGISAIEVPVHSMERSTLRSLGCQLSPRLGVEAIGRLNRYRFRSIVHLTPGLPGSSHPSAMRSARLVLAARPSALRLLPALVLQDTRLAALHARSPWEPMTEAEAVFTCRHILDLARAQGVEIVRLGLQPEVDLLRGPELIAGPWDPDFRGRVECERMRLLATAALTSEFSLGRRAFTFVVHPREESWLRGRSCANLRMLKDQFRLDQLKILTFEEQPLGELRAFCGVLDEVPPLPPRRGAKRAS